ncbi:MAG: GxGYxYP family putative glycoside hydrolase [Armatimonadetes bacterium]|nr:GxGYxYP family putative glycoside hydrolase [Armatimonadota bacterium]
MEAPAPLMTYTLAHDGTPASYDEAVAAACIQGIVNRKAPALALLSPQDKKSRFWIDTMKQPGRWLAGREEQPIVGLDALRSWAGSRLKGAVIWDPAVPATLNLATTLAGVRDGVALSPELAEKALPGWGLPVLQDFRGRFTGAETGSAKNDAYRWAIREFLAKGLCSGHWLCLYEDAYSTRARGDIGYVNTRDWAVRNRSFVYDLSPWGDEVPQDDPGQKPGTDLETYHLLLAELMKQTAGKQMTEVAGFFAFSKYSNMPDHASRHDPVPTEWETVYLISPYNCYQNTVASDCYNQSLHVQAPRKPLKQKARPAGVKLADKTYVCVLMADYDSMTPLYQFLPDNWLDPKRGSLPLAWGLNPNLVETYPDIFQYLYETASPNDHFGADASAAGYMNPNRIAPEHMPLFIRHNQRFFKECDMTMAPMVLDWDEPTPAVKDAFTKFAPDGFATIVMDLHGKGGKLPEPQVWKGMPVLELINDGCNFTDVETHAGILSSAISARPQGKPAFHFFRIVWTGPGNVAATLERLQAKRPELDIEVVGPADFFRLFKESKARTPGD